MDGRIVAEPIGEVWPGFARGPVYLVGRDFAGSVALVGRTLAGWLGRDVAFLELDQSPSSSFPLADATMVVLERPPSCGCGNPLCGSTLSRVGCPLLVVPAQLPHDWPGNGPILAPLDGSDDAAVGATVARELAACGSRGLEVLHVAIPDAAPTGAVPFPRLWDQAHHEWRAWHNAFLSRFCACAHGQTPLLVRSGAPDGKILEVACERHVALIVLAWHGVLTAGRARTLAGVIAGADRPILLVGFTGTRNEPFNACGS